MKGKADWLEYFGFLDEVPELTSCLLCFLFLGASHSTLSDKDMVGYYEKTLSIGWQCIERGSGCQ